MEISEASEKRLPFRRFCPREHVGSASMMGERFRRGSLAWVCVCDRSGGAGVSRFRGCTKSCPPGDEWRDDGTVR